MPSFGSTLLFDMLDPWKELSRFWEIAPTRFMADIMFTHSHRVGHYAMMAVVCPVPDHKSRIERCSKLIIGRRAAHDTVTRDPFQG